MAQAQYRNRISCLEGTWMHWKLPSWHCNYSIDSKMALRFICHDNVALMMIIIIFQYNDNSTVVDIIIINIIIINLWCCSNTCCCSGGGSHILTILAPFVQLQTIDPLNDQMWLQLEHFQQLWILPDTKQIQSMHRKMHQGQCTVFFKRPQHL